jgi:hypothetical protein
MIQLKILGWTVVMGEVVLDQSVQGWGGLTNEVSAKHHVTLNLVINSFMRLHILVQLSCEGATLKICSNTRP